MAGRGHFSALSSFASGALQDAEVGYRGRLGGSHTNLERLNEGSTEYHGLLNKPQAATTDCGPDGVGSLGQLDHEGEPAGVYLGRLSGKRYSSGRLSDEDHVLVSPPSQTTVPRLNNPEDAAHKTAYHGRLSSCNSGKNSWNVANHVEAA